MWSESLIGTYLGLFGPKTWHLAKTQNPCKNHRLIWWNSAWTDWARWKIQQSQPNQLTWGPDVVYMWSESIIHTYLGLFGFWPQNMPFGPNSKSVYKSPVYLLILGLNGLSTLENTTKPALLTNLRPWCSLYVVWITNWHLFGAFWPENMTFCQDSKSV